MINSFNIDQLKRFHKTGGIYLICNRWNSKMYVGSTKVNFQSRWKEHINSLRSNKHPNKDLQKDFNKFPESYWEFKILEICSDDLTSREGYWASLFGNYNMGFICHKTFRDHPNAKRVVQIDMDTLKVVKSYDSMLQATRESNGYFAASHIGQCCQRKQQKHKGYYWCYEKDLDSFKPLKLNYRRTVKKFGQFDRDNNLLDTFLTVKEAHEKLNISEGALWANLSGRTKSAYGYIFKYIK